jgi:FkbM family methyltransferase
MKQAFRNAVQSSLGKFGVGLVRLETQARNAKARTDLEFLRAMPSAATAQVLQNFDKSQAQLRQDLFVLAQLGFKRGGYFVEFGAANGIYLSNTYLLEKEFGWTGILAEPARSWQSALASNRSAAIESRCVWSRSAASLTFNEVDNPELSTIDSFSGSDAHRKARTAGTTYEVKTISLNDLLREHSAPAEIDYLSIDTEGSEFEILEAFDFSRHRFRVITCEHNFTPAREKIAALLGPHGYTRKYPAISQWDDWYVHEGQDSR